MDVLGAQIDENSVAIPEKVLIDSRSSPDSREVDEALKLLAGAARPVIMIGPGAYFSGAEAELRKFAEATGTPGLFGFSSARFASEQSPALWRHVSQDGRPFRARSTA